MADRDYAATPMADALGLREIIRDLAADISDLRAGVITVDDAFARAALAKQVFNGVRLYAALIPPVPKPAQTPTTHGLARPCADTLPGAGATIRKNNNNGV